MRSSLPSREGRARAAYCIPTSAVGQLDYKALCKLLVPQNISKTMQSRLSYHYIDKHEIIPVCIGYQLILRALAVICNDSQMHFKVSTPYTSCMHWAAGLGYIHTTFIHRDVKKHVFFAFEIFHLKYFMLTSLFIHLAPLRARQLFYVQTGSQLHILCKNETFRCNLLALLCLSCPATVIERDGTFKDLMLRLH